MIFSKDYPLNILIAENNPDARASTTTIITELGYQPRVAGSTEEVLHLTCTESYDVILMDIHMPAVEDMLATRLSDRKDGRPLIIGITGNARPGFKQICLQAGMDHHIRRPVDPQELKLQLKACSVLSGNRRIRTTGE